MTQRNTEAQFRQYLPGGSRYNPQGVRPSDLPEWLANQWYQTSPTGSEGGDNTPYWQGPTQVLRDSQGREVYLLNDDLSPSHEDLDLNPGAQAHAYFDPGLGWVVPAEFTNNERGHNRIRRRGNIALATVLGGAALGASGVLGAGTGGGVGAAGEGLAATIPADIATGGAAVGGASVPLDIAPSIVGGGGGTALAAPELIGAGGTALGGGALGGGSTGLEVAATGSGGVGADIAAGGAGSSWANYIPDAMNLIGAGIDAFGPNSPSRLGEEERNYNREMWAEALRANRPNINTPFMNQTWERDPETGQYTLNQSLNPQDQSRLEQYRGIASDRMTQAATPLRINWGRLNPRLADIMPPSLGGGSLGG